nr:reverse transcriptase domain-containing protein [Tanacetum cinerariifolium]
MLERLAGNEYYCFLDGFSGYFQIPIDPKDQEKTTFMCPYGMFAYRHMPFGLCNAPGTFQRCLHEVKGGVRVAFEDKFRATEEIEMLCEAQQGRSRVKRKVFGSFRNKMGNEPILALPEGSDNFVVMREARRRWMELFSDYGCETEYHMEKANIVVDAWRRKGGVKPRRVRDICKTIQAKISEKMVGDVRTLIIEEAHATKYSVRPEAEIGEIKMIGLEMEQETTKVVVIKERLKEAKDRVERFGKKGELAPRYRISQKRTKNKDLAREWKDFGNAEAKDEDISKDYFGPN